MMASFCAKIVDVSNKIYAVIIPMTVEMVQMSQKIVVS